MFNLFNKKLPDPQQVFTKYFAIWYPPEERTRLVRPDMYKIAGFKGKSLDSVTMQYLAGDKLNKEKDQITRMEEAALGDYQTIITSNILDIKVLDAVDKFYDRKNIRDIIKNSDPKDFNNLYLVSVCEFGVMLGYLFKQNPDCDWLYSHPYFNSIIVHKKTGWGIPVFDWAIKKFSEYGVDDGFAAKVIKVNKDLATGNRI